MSDDNMHYQKYHDTSVPQYFVTSSVVDNFCKNPTMFPNPSTPNGLWGSNAP